jgi:hypothetical protein
MAIYSFMQSCMWFIQAAFLAAFLTQTNSHREAANVFTALIPAFAFAALAIVLFFCQPFLARCLIAPVSEAQKDVPFSLEEIQGIVFAAVGLIILSSTLPEIGRACQTAYLWFEYFKNSPGPDNLPPRDWSYAGGVLAQLIVGLFLLFNPRGFRNAWHWLRTAGTRPNSD